MTESPSAARPRAVTIAYWCWMVAAVLLIVSGLASAMLGTPLPLIYQGAGIIVVLAGVGMAYVTGRIRTADPRFQRAGVALSMAIVLLVAVASVAGLVDRLAAIALLPLIAGTVSIRSAAAQAWFDGGGGR
jgi:hypothetical protein